MRDLPADEGLARPTWRRRVGAAGQPAASVGSATRVPPSVASPAVGRCGTEPAIPARSAARTAAGASDRSPDSNRPGRLDLEHRERRRVEDGAHARRPVDAGRVARPAVEAMGRPAEPSLDRPVAQDPERVVRLGGEIGGVHVEARLVHVRAAGRRAGRDAGAALVAQVGEDGHLEPLGHGEGPRPDRHERPVARREDRDLRPDRRRLVGQEGQVRADAHAQAAQRVAVEAAGGLAPRLVGGVGQGRLVEPAAAVEAGGADRDAVRPVGPAHGERADVEIADLAVAGRRRQRGPGRQPEEPGDRRGRPLAVRGRLHDGRRAVGRHVAARPDARDRRRQRLRIRGDEPGRRVSSGARSPNRSSTGDWLIARMSVSSGSSASEPGTSRGTLRPEASRVPS